MTSYNDISSSDYINNLTFDLVEIYSFQRGKEFEESRKASRREYERLKVRKEKYNHLTVLEEKRFLELHDLLGFTQYLINDQGIVHPSAEKTHTFKATDPEIDRLKTILGTEINQLPTWMCAPIYRDAIIFYDKSHSMVSTLNICLSCEYMETKRHCHISGDSRTYALLRQYFTELGHKIEDH